MGQSVLNRRPLGRRLSRRGTAWSSFVALESRQLLAASFGGELWKIAGTDRDDRITVVQDGRDPSLLQLRVNGEVTQRARIGKLRTIWIDGRSGDDRLDVQVPAQFGKRIKVRLDGASGNDTLVGGPTVDELRGGTGDDVLLGRERNDVLDGGTGADDLSGDDGSDSLVGGAGHDKLAGGAGMDTLRGAGGDDSLSGGSDGDKLFGERGRDQLDGGAGRDRLDGGSDVDSMRHTPRRDDVRGPADERRASGTHPALERIAANLAAAAVERAVESNRWAFGKSLAEMGSHLWLTGYADNGSVRLFRTASLAFDSRLAATDAAVSGSAASVVSETNVQEAGVDEADTVETDGRYIYSLDGDELIVTDVRDPRDLKIVSRTALEGSVSGIYLLPGGRLTVVSQTGGFAWWGWRGARLAITEDGAAANQPTGPQVTITTYDVSDAAAPSVTNTTTLDGSLQSSRVVDGRMYVVLRSQLDTTQVETVGTGAEERYETEGEFRARIDSLGDAVLPGYTSVTGDRTVSGTIMSDATTFAGATTSTNGSYATVVGIDLAAPENGPFASTSVESGWVQTTYASKDSIYLAGMDWDAAGNWRTNIVKLSLAGGAITLDATGSIAGRADQSFNFDESGDLLRVSSTRLDGNQLVNAVTVLRDTGDTLEQIGIVDGLAPTESIFATRFIDDRCYLVTFRQTDPLFVIDLSDPTKPTVEGELKVPGRSTYLHPLADDLLFGVGQEFDEAGRRTGQLKLQLFDVRDASNPRELDVQYVGDERSFSMSNAENDHHAFQYFADAGVIALPTSQGEETVMSLFKVDRETGIESVGEFGAAPGWWWTDMKPVRIDDAVFAVDANHVASATLAEGESLDEVTINEVEQPLLPGGGWIID